MTFRQEEIISLCKFIVQSIATLRFLLFLSLLLVMVADVSEDAAAEDAGVDIALASLQRPATEIEADVRRVCARFDLFAAVEHVTVHMHEDDSTLPPPPSLPSAEPPSEASLSSAVASPPGTQPGSSGHAREETKEKERGVTVAVRVLVARTHSLALAMEAAAAARRAILMHVPDVRAVEVDLDLLGMQRMLMTRSDGSDTQPPASENEKSTRTL